MATKKYIVGDTPHSTMKAAYAHLKKISKLKEPSVAELAKMNKGTLSRNKFLVPIKSKIAGTTETLTYPDGNTIKVMMSKGLGASKSKKEEMTVWVAMKEERDWAENRQITITDTWENIAKIAEGISKMNKKEVRVSTTKGYNNQGYYFYKS